MLRNTEKAGVIAKIKDAPGAEMSTPVRNACRTPRGGEDVPTFELFTTISAHRQRAMALLQAI